MKESENTQGKSSAIPSTDGLGARREVGKWLNELYDQPANKFDVAHLCAEYDRQQESLIELREISKLAFRALDDAYRVLSTIDGDDSHEQYELGVLAKRVQDVAISLFTVLRHAPN